MLPLHSHSDRHFQMTGVSLAVLLLVTSIGRVLPAGVLFIDNNGRTVDENYVPGVFVPGHVADESASVDGCLAGCSGSDGILDWSGGPGFPGALDNDGFSVNGDGTFGDEKISNQSFFRGSQSWRLSRGRDSLGEQNHCHCVVGSCHCH